MSFNVLMVIFSAYNYGINYDKYITINRMQIEPFKYAHAHTHTYIYIYISTGLYVNKCVYVYEIYVVCV